MKKIGLLTVLIVVMLILTSNSQILSSDAKAAVEIESEANRQQTMAIESATIEIANLSCQELSALGKAVREALEQERGLGNIRKIPSYRAEELALEAENVGGLFSGFVGFFRKILVGFGLINVKPPENVVTLSIESEATILAIGEVAGQWLKGFGPVGQLGAAIVSILTPLAEWGGKELATKGALGDIGYFKVTKPGVGTMDVVYDKQAKETCVNIDLEDLKEEWKESYGWENEHIYMYVPFDEEPPNLKKTRGEFDYRVVFKGDALTRFEVGDIVMVTDTDDSGLNVRDAPAGTVVKTVPDGWKFRVTDGSQPALLEGQMYTWWEVEETEYEPSPVTGWAAEKYLKKVPSDNDLVPRLGSAGYEDFVSAQGKVKQAMEWAMNPERRDEGWWKNYCLGFVAAAFGVEDIGWGCPIGCSLQEPVRNCPMGGVKKLSVEGKFYSAEDCWNPPRGGLVFFSGEGEDPGEQLNYELCGHIGIYLGKGKVVHAYGTPRIQDLAGKGGIEREKFIDSYIGWAYPPEEWLSVPKEEPGEWTKTFGGTGDDAGFSVQQTSDGGYVIVGSTESYGAGKADAWLIKTDSSGNKVWDKTFGGTSIDWGLSVQQTVDGGYILAGMTESYGAGDQDVWLIKTDSDGNKKWDKTFGGEGNDAAYSVQQTSDGGYILAGETDSYGAGGNDLYLIKTDSDGNRVWHRTFGGPRWADCALAVEETTDGGYIVGGQTSAHMKDDTGFWLIKTDRNGGEMWERVFGSISVNERGTSVQQTSDGGYIMTGIVGMGGGREDSWLVKTDSSGNKVWDKTLGGSADDFAASVQETLDGGYIIAGGTESYGAGGGDAWLIKTDSKGNKLWDRTFGGTSDDAAYSVHQTLDGGYVIAGTTKSYGAGSSDLWLIKVGDKQTGSPSSEKADLRDITGKVLVRSYQSPVQQPAIRGINRRLWALDPHTLYKTPLPDEVWDAKKSITISLSDQFTSLSPDGRKVASFWGPRQTVEELRSLKASGVDRIFIIDLDDLAGTSIQFEPPATNVNYCSLCWSPDGNKLAFNSFWPNSGLYVVDIRSGDIDRIVDDAEVYDFAWSPDSTRIVFSGKIEYGRSGLFVIESDGSNREYLSVSGSRPAWSPDGKRIAFIDTKDPSTESLCILNLDNCQVKEVLTSTDMHVARIAWSPDGSEIAFGTRKALRVGGGWNEIYGSIYVINADGSNLRTLVHADEPFTVIPWGAQLESLREEIRNSAITQNELVAWISSH